MENAAQNSPPSMTPQQRLFATAEREALRSYKQLLVGMKGWGYFLSFELYNLLFSWLPSLLGIILRRLILPFFLRSGGKGIIIGRNVTFRSPGSVTVGKSVVVDDYAVVDVRIPEGQGSSQMGIEIGDHVFIGRHSIVSAKFGTIILHRACNIGTFCRIATQSSIEIGESVLIAAYVYIGGGNHRADRLDQPIMEQGMEIRGGVKIGVNSWIGTKATILDGVTIGRDAIVGAHSLVMEDVPDRAIVAGTPAKIIRYRD